VLSLPQAIGSEARHADFECDGDRRNGIGRHDKRDPPMRWTLARIGFGLATLPIGYWGFVNGWQVITAITFATRMDAPAALWVLTGLYGVHFVVACAAWLIGLQGLAARRPRPALAGTIVALVASWPSLALLYVRVSGS
jgi:hypothetical protein